MENKCLFSVVRLHNCMLHKSIVLALIIASISIILLSCETDNNQVPHSDIKLKIERLDQHIFNQSVEEVSSTYPDFAEIYFQNIVNIKNDSDSLNETQLNQFKSDEFITELKHKTDSIYPQLDELESQLAASIDLFQQATGDSNIPNFYSFIGGLSYQNFLFDDNGSDGIGIGLDMFLGDAFPYEQLSVQNPAFSKYISRTFNKEHINKKVIETMIDDKIGQAKGNRMLDYMIHNGKKSYLLNQFIPFAHDSIIMEYTGDQLQWCEENQSQIWSYFLREELFYETDYKKINKLINASPGSPGMPDEAPGQTANFIGWKIVTEFMKRNPDVSITDLMSLQDYQKILDKSKYKPT